VAGGRGNRGIAGDRAAHGERKRVFRLASQGLGVREIARELCVSPKTAETHRYRVKTKLGLRNAADLVRFAAKHGLLRIPPR
jgi:DNA-binding NarL/FixJ family response regulator